MRACCASKPADAMENDPHNNPSSGANASMTRQISGYAKHLYNAGEHLIEVDALCQPSPAGVKFRAMVKITRGKEVERHDLQNEAYGTLEASLSALLQTTMTKIEEQSG
ncbi:hypothetical protein HO173_005917 [Letharia columbiana]|uniref:Uncharacterized protein n=1 Tax=Letharia columbiana TaxID=112416 RepID=A0A8H6FW16_9LECA|nr:uncharacterized protein HO173_005917 [Letharia columbiana]KAF6235722.1 hypothetical protein HO173_005917 [Letharia columbiana]